MRQLRSVEVYQCKKVLIRWIITSWAGATIEGLPETGRLKLDLHSETMRLFLQEDVNDSFPPLELSEALAKFCGIIDADHGFILSHILFQHNFQAIENDLRRRGIPNNFPGSELEPELVTGKPSFLKLGCCSLDSDQREQIHMSCLYQIYSKPLQ